MKFIQRLQRIWKTRILVRILHQLETLYNDCRSDVVIDYSTKRLLQNGLESGLCHAFYFHCERRKIAKPIQRQFAMLLRAVGVDPHKFIGPTPRDSQRKRDIVNALILRQELIVHLLKSIDEYRKGKNLDQLPGFHPGQPHENDLRTGH